MRVIHFALCVTFGTIGLASSFVFPVLAADSQSGIPVSTPAIGGRDGSASSPPGVMTAPVTDNPEATAAEASGPIAVHDAVSDDSVLEKLQKLLPRYPGVRSIEIEVEDGVVTLTGHVADAETRDRLRDFVRRVQGVNLVLNRTKTDAQVLSAREYTQKQLSDYLDVISRGWLLALVAFAVFLGAIALARLFNRYSDTLLVPFAWNPLLRSVLGSVISLGIIAGGCLGALHLLGMTEAVLSFLGLAGVVALAVGFAFRDIAENFIASVMLGVRRPFRVGDFIEVAGMSGVVASLNTRATVLITLDGSHVRIPNATIFKAILVNKTASSAVRGSFDVVIPWDASIAMATEVMTNAICRHEGIEGAPAARTLVESIEIGGVRLRSYFWFPARGVDRVKLLSDVQLAAKAALQQAGIAQANSAFPVSISGTESGAVRRPRQHEVVGGQRSAVASPELEATIRLDTEAATVASSQLPEDQENEIGHALDNVDGSVDEEGRNLIAEKGKKNP